MAVISVHRANAGQEIDAILVVLAQVRALAVASKTDLATIIAKLNLDAGVTDVNYAAVATAALAAPDTISEVY